MSPVPKSARIEFDAVCVVVQEKTSIVTHEYDNGGFTIKDGMLVIFGEDSLWERVYAPGEWKQVYGTYGDE